MSKSKYQTLKKLFGINLRAARKELRLNQAEFAYPIAISGSYISDIERGAVERPSEPVIRAIANYYRINREWLETGKGDMFLPEEKEHPAPDKSPINIETLASVLMGVEDALKAKDMVLEPEKKARLISLLYAHFSKTGEKPNQKTIISYLKLVA